jgi:copper/silver efflux system protein
MSFINQKISQKKIKLPAGVNFSPAGSYENHLRAQKVLKIIIPVSLILIFIIIYFQFNSVVLTLLVFSGVMIAWSGGFIMLWLYGQKWFLNFSLFGVNMRELMQIHPVNLSVAVWVGFLALFGIATDDGVVMGTYLKQIFEKEKPVTIDDIRKATLKAGNRRVKACLMTTATTILALFPVLTSTGRGSDVMIPMAIPIFGGMIFEIITMLVVPVLFSLVHETKFRFKNIFPNVNNI